MDFLKENKKKKVKNLLFCFVCVCVMANLKVNSVDQYVLDFEQKHNLEPYRGQGRNLRLTILTILYSLPFPPVQQRRAVTTLLPYIQLLDATPKDWTRVNLLLTELYGGEPKESLEQLVKIWTSRTIGFPDKTQKPVIKLEEIKSGSDTLIKKQQDQKQQEQQQQLVKTEVSNTSRVKPFLDVADTQIPLQMSGSRGTWFATGPELTGHDTLPERYCSCVFKMKSKQKTPNPRLPYASCSKSVYNSRGKSGPGSVRCRYVPEYLQHFSKDEIYSYLENSEKLDEPLPPLDRTTRDELMEILHRYFEKTRKWISKSEYQQWKHSLPADQRP